MAYVALFVAGVIVGAAIVLIINRFRQKDIEKSFSALSREGSEGIWKRIEKLLPSEADAVLSD